MKNHPQPSAIGYRLSAISTPIKTLQLVLKYRWFCLIHAGIKKTEFRKLVTYWKKRLLQPDGTPRTFDQVRFRWGYQSDAPEMTLQCLGIIQESSPRRFNIQLGEILEKKNCETIGQPTAQDIAAHRRMIAKPRQS